jgi:hypothetical protein
MFVSTASEATDNGGGRPSSPSQLEKDEAWVRRVKLEAERAGLKVKKKKIEK